MEAAIIALDRTVAVATRTKTTSFAATAYSQQQIDIPPAERATIGTTLQPIEEAAAGAIPESQSLVSKAAN
jgi:hypothetical protein